MTCTKSRCKKKGSANYKCLEWPSKSLNGKGQQSHKAALAVTKQQENKKKCNEKNMSDTKKNWLLARLKIVRWMAKEGLALLKFESFLELLVDLDTPYLLLFLKRNRDANRIANILTWFVWKKIPFLYV